MMKDYLIILQKVNIIKPFKNNLFSFFLILIKITIPIHIYIFNKFHFI